MTLFLLAAILVAGVAAFTDYRTGHIPNWLTIGPLVVAPVAHLIFALSQHGTKLEALIAASYSILGAVVCGILPVGFYRLNAIGGGDVKLFVALGAILRPELGGEAELWGFLATGLIAPFLLAYQGKLFKTVTNAVFLVMNPFLNEAKRRSVQPQEMSWFRMGPAIFLGTLYLGLEHWRDPPAWISP